MYNTVRHHPAISKHLGSDTSKPETLSTDGISRQMFVFVRRSLKLPDLVILTKIKTAVIVFLKCIFNVIIRNLF